MGCASSKQKRCCNCQNNASSPVPRSYSMHVHHPAQHNGDSYHMVALTSSTLGSLNENSNSYNKSVPSGYDHDNKSIRPHAEDKRNGNVDTLENLMKRNENEGGLHEKLMEAKIWSSMMQNKIPKITPKTPSRTPPGEPETINTWEMMEGLEDVTPFRSPTHPRSFSFDITRSPPQIPFDRPTSRFQQKNGLVLEPASTKPIWLQIKEDDDNNNPDGNFKDLEFDPEIISSFRRSLHELPLDHPFHIPLRESENHTPLANSVIKDVEQQTDKKLVSLDVSDYKTQSKVLVYITTLRGVRKTFEDCCQVRVILKGLGFRVDERDVSMHSEFKDELKVLLGDQCSLGGISLPKVFLGRNCLGGADEIRKLHEEGQLEKVLEGCEMVEDYELNGGLGACEACGDVRFLLCDTCTGSCKVYYEFDEEEDEDEQEHKELEGEESEFGFQRCPDCNENGLIRCPVCCN